MNKKVKKLWIEALRSGEYEQTTMKLANEQGDAFCCLGVLCDLYASSKDGEGAGFESEVDGRLTFYDTPCGVSGESSGYLLTEAVERWSGITSSLELKAHSLNDRGRSFQEIADFLEEEA